MFTKNQTQQLVKRLLKALFKRQCILKTGIPGCSAGKEFACNAGDSGSIPESRRFPWRRERLPTLVFLGFPGGSDGKESTCNAEDLGSIPGLGRPAQLVKNLPAMQETWVRFLGREDPLEKEMATHFSILAWRIPWTEETGRLQSMMSKESDTT